MGDFSGPTPVNNPMQKKTPAKKDDKAPVDGTNLNLPYRDCNVVFWLYRTFTYNLMILLTVSLLPAYFGLDLAQIKCMRNGGNVCEDKGFAAYCWTHGTHTVVRYLNATVGNIGLEVPYPGIGKLMPTDEILHHWSYLWTLPYLFLAAYMFRAPGYIWENYFDAERFIVIAKEVHILLIGDKVVAISKTKSVVGYLMLNLHGHNGTAFRYIFCEVLNFINLILQVYITNNLLQGQFMTYGWDVVTYLNQKSGGNIIDPFMRLFPKMTTCHLNLIGPSGNAVLHEGICVLPLNTYLEKVFLGLWFLYCILGITSVFCLIYRALTLYVPEIRLRLLKWHLRNLKPRTAATICRHCSYGDWFLIFSLVSSNSNPMMEETLEDFAAHLERMIENN